MCCQTQNNDDWLPVHRCTLRFGAPGGSGYWSAVFGSRTDQHSNIELPGDFWCSGGIYGVNVTTLAGRWLCQINISYKSTDARYSKSRSLCVTSLKNIHLISCFFGILLKFWFDLVFQFLRLQRVFCFTALAHLLHDPIATSASAPVSCWFPGRLVGDPECNLAARAVLQKHKQNSEPQLPRGCWKWAAESAESINYCTGMLQMLHIFSYHCNSGHLVLAVLTCMLIFQVLSMLCGVLITKVLKGQLAKWHS